MEPQAPAINPIAQLELRQVNGQFNKIRQRLDNIERRSVAAPATAEAVGMGATRTAQLAAQIASLQQQVAAIVSQPPSGPGTTPQPVATSRTFAFFAG